MRKRKLPQSFNNVLYRIRHKTIKTAIGSYWKWYIDTKEKQRSVQNA